MPLFLHKVGKNRRADDRKKARHDDGQAAHRALDLADLERLGRAQRVRGRANAHALGDGVGDAEKPAHRNCDHVAENAGDDDHGDRQRHVAAELFGYAHADGRRDGLRQKRHVFLVCKMKELAHHKHAAKRRDDTGENTGEDGLPVALQKR